MAENKITLEVLDEQEMRAVDGGGFANLPAVQIARHAARTAMAGMMAQQIAQRSIIALLAQSGLKVELLV